ncbi:hypothetical protein NKH86_29845 [Mesorhizobium sp. M0913]|uniref:hypothetical protein n=1 Tax=Mesorhizobium sp. M0913 TaxID=2957026 RepID=UPI003338BCD7
MADKRTGPPTVTFFIFVTLLTIATTMAAPARPACAEAVIGDCYPQYSAISAVVEAGSGFAALGEQETGFDLLRISASGKILGHITIDPPTWVGPEASAPKFEDMVAGPDGTLLLIGWAVVTEADISYQAGVVALVSMGGAVTWSNPLRQSGGTSTILYAGTYDTAGKRFLVVGRHTNGADNGKCEFWSQGIVLSIPEADVTHAFPVRFVGASEPGPRNRIALYDIMPIGAKGQFVATGFATAKAAGNRCQDNAMAVQISGGAKSDWTIGKPYVIGAGDADEDAYAIADGGKGRFLLAGKGTFSNTGAPAALLAAFTFANAAPMVRIDPFPEDGSDTTGGDRYRVIVPLKEEGRYLVAGSASQRRQDRNQGIWQFISSTLESPGPANFLTHESGSDIAGAALGQDGRVLAVGTHGQGKNTIGWMGLLNDQVTSAGTRREPDSQLPMLDAKDMEAGSIVVSRNEIGNGVGFRGPHMTARAQMEFRFSLVDAIDITATALASTGDVDLALMDSHGAILAYSSNLGDAGEYLHAKVGPGDYGVKLIAASYVSDFEFRTMSADVGKEVMLSLSGLDPDGRKALNAFLKNAGYGDGGNPDIGLGGDTVCSVLAYYNTLYADFRPAELDSVIANATPAAPQ